MPASTLPNIPLKYGWSIGENGWGSGMDDNIIAMGSVTQLAVLDRSLSAPPGSPVSGDRYIVGAGATGGWNGHDGKIALYLGAAWRFYVPQDGWIAYDQNDGVTVRMESGLWREIETLVKPALIANEAGATKTLTEADSLSVVRFTGASAVTLTVPANTTEAIRTGTTFRLRQAGTGLLSVAPEVGVTVNSRASLNAAGQHASLVLVKVGTDEWDLSGDIAP